MRSACKASDCVGTNENVLPSVAVGECVPSTSSFNEVSDCEGPGMISEKTTVPDLLGASSFRQAARISCTANVERRADSALQLISRSRDVGDVRKILPKLDIGTHDWMWSPSSSNVPCVDASSNTDSFEVRARIAVNTPACVLSCSSSDVAPTCRCDADKDDWQSWKSMRDIYPDSDDENDVENEEDDEEASESICDEHGPWNLPLTLFVDMDVNALEHGYDKDEDKKKHGAEEEEAEKTHAMGENKQDEEEVDEKGDDDFLSDLREHLQKTAGREPTETTESEYAPEPCVSERTEPEPMQCATRALLEDDKKNDVRIRYYIIHGGYEGLKAAFARRKETWAENADPGSLHFDFKWAPHTQVDWHLLQPHQFLNHIPHMNNLTCKGNLCRRAREMLDNKSMSPFFSVEDLSEWIPDCYDFAVHADMFTQKYRMLHAMAILGQWLLSVNARRKKTSTKKRLIGSLFRKIGGVFRHKARKDWADRIDIEVIRAALGSCQRAVAGEKDCVLQRDWYLLSTNAVEKTNKQRRRSVTLAGEELSILEKDAIDVLVALSKDPQWHMNGYRNAWIVKPGTLARGKFIQVLRNFHGITRLCSSKVYLDDPKKTGGRKLCTSWLVQKYIENPLLLPMNGEYYKHDLRVWVLVKCDSLDFYAWIWNKPYVRLAGSPWDQKVSEMRAGTESMWTAQTFRNDEAARSMHLTNYSVSKQTEQCDAAQFIWQLDRYKSFLKDRQDEDFWTNHLWPRIKQIARQSLLWIRPYLGPLRDKSFQLLGYDLLVTDNLQVWLIEVNGAPDLSVSWPGKKVLLDNMWEEMLSLVIDKPPALVTRHFDPLHPFPRGVAAQVRGLRAALVPQSTTSSKRRPYTSKTPTAGTLRSVATLDMSAQAEMCPRDSSVRNLWAAGPTHDVPVAVPQQTSEASVCSSHTAPHPHCARASRAQDDVPNLHVISHAQSTHWRHANRKNVAHTSRASGHAHTSIPGMRPLLPHTARTVAPTRGDRQCRRDFGVPVVTCKTPRTMTSYTPSLSSPTSPCSPTGHGAHSRVSQVDSPSTHKRTVEKMKPRSTQGGGMSLVKEAKFWLRHASSNLRNGARSSRAQLHSSELARSGSLGSLGTPISAGKEGPGQVITS